MSTDGREFSPDGRFFILSTSYEMRMSHWLSHAALWDAASRQLLLEVGNSLWSTEKVTWAPDSSSVVIALRRYPGDAPGIELDVFPDLRVVVPRPPARPETITFGGVDEFLEDYYETHRRKD
jgi:hypothetical protein